MLSIWSGKNPEKKYENESCCSEMTEIMLKKALNAIQLTLYRMTHF